VTAYLDSSVLVKLYLPESDSEAVQELASSDPDLWIYELSVVEVVSAFAKKRRSEEITPDFFLQCCRFFAQDVASGRFRISTFREEDKERSVRILMGPGSSRRITSIDALIVSSAVRTAESRPGIILWSEDSGQVFAATESGLRVKDLSKPA
jgi:hypothetical protein